MLTEPRHRMKTRSSKENGHADYTIPVYHRPPSTCVHVCGAIGYNYKSPLIFIEGHGKNGAFTSKDYLEQVFEGHLLMILDQLNTVAPGQIHFQEDGNPAHGIKSTETPCNIWKRERGIELLEWGPNSPDMAAIEHFWRSMKEWKRALKIQPKTCSRSQIGTSTAMGQSVASTDQWLHSVNAKACRYIIK